MWFKKVVALGVLLAILAGTGWLVASSPGGPDGGIIVGYHGAEANSGTLLSGLTATVAGKVPKSAYTAKGVILAGSTAGTPGALAGATNGYVLMRDSAAALGIKWATAPAVGDTAKMNKKPAYAGRLATFAASTGDAADGGTLGTAAHHATGYFEPAISGGATVKANKFPGHGGEIATLDVNGDLEPGGTLGSICHAGTADYVHSGSTVYALVGHNHAGVYEPVIAGGATVKANKLSGHTGHIASLSSTGDLADGGTLGTIAKKATGDYVLSGSTHYEPAFAAGTTAQFLNGHNAFTSAFPEHYFAENQGIQVQALSADLTCASVTFNATGGTYLLSWSSLVTIVGAGWQKGWSIAYLDNVPIYGAGYIATNIFITIDGVLPWQTVSGSTEVVLTPGSHTLRLDWSDYTGAGTSHNSMASSVRVVRVQ